ncbi:M1 family metallopeptidase [Acetobacter cerevisiae]|uniref:Aminopeptidase n=1 Tax=Acetobacter cerevisiae TaxID=178900 RepID=A0ABT1ERX5_9PROT|nr:M1 family metallopeptidase [Acetobacter cerevisiae]MCP1246108.1 M1 family metallopeptidase [Acetobacter cerevisiae]MCP1255608.1 M1 family metallopeptidase [Acetobacter cerevisiae]
MRRLLTLTTLLAGLPLAAPVCAEQVFSFQRAAGQLPKTVVPVSYGINISTDIDNLKLTGQETIQVDVRTPTEDVTLNQAGLHLAGAVLDNGVKATITQDDTAETATLHFPAKVSKGAHTLVITYSGPILKTPNGIYVDDYTAPSGETKRMLVTQFEVADARRMFPGWDEPAFKATFQLNVTLPKEAVAVSNMPVTQSTPEGTSQKRVSFATTPRMSTYLLALVAGDMKSVQGQADGTPLAVYAPSGLEGQGEYALHASEKILPYYNSYFGVKYPLPKMDMVAIPGNYQAGAMENWGLLTYIDNVLLFDPKNSTPRTRELIYEVVAHEMAHQWSGDLVTMGWWDNIWLNEGFASWMEIKATDKMNPDWDIWPRQHETREETMGTDALPSTHPIQQTIHNVSEANSAFDSISYGKGELVIRMLEGWLGEDHFRDGMRLYMKSHAYSSSTSQDLWQALSKTSGLDVGPVARSFTEQPGIPLVNVASACKAGKTVYTLTQSRFTIHDPHPAAQTWMVPVVAGGPGLATQKLVLGKAPQTLSVAGCDAPLKLNLGESGYYRVQYSAPAFASLLKNAPHFAPVDRANLLGDQFALFRSGQAPLSAYMDLANSLLSAQESDIAVLEEIIGRFETLDQYLKGSPDRAAFRAYARKQLAPVLARLGWDQKVDENVLDTMLRPSVISVLGRFEDPAVVTEADKRFARWQADPASLKPDLVGVVARIAMTHADEKTYAAMAEKVRTTQATEVKLRLFNALAAATNPALIEKNVALAYSGAIPNGRIAMALGRVADESENPDLVWQLVKQHEAEIRTHLAPWSQDGFLAAIAAYSDNPDVAHALEADPSSSKTTGGKIATAKALSEIGARKEAMQAAQSQLHIWLGAQH